MEILAICVRRREAIKCFLSLRRYVCIGENTVYSWPLNMLLLGTPTSWAVKNPGITRAGLPTQIPNHELSLEQHGFELMGQVKKLHVSGSKQFKPMCSMVHCIQGLVLFTISGIHWDPWNGYGGVLYWQGNLSTQNFMPSKTVFQKIEVK